MRWQHAKTYDAVLAAPFAHLGVVASTTGLRQIDFLTMDYSLRLPEAASAPVRQLALALSIYWDNAAVQFDLPMVYQASPHQQRVWQALLAIPVGQTRSYGDIAAEIGSSPRAVGQACGANPLPIVIPCHRVVAKNGRGGFMHQREGAALDYKLWLLAHESRVAVAD
ncbi:MAG: methylated-DNA--[protein]-cysteine S-methyltransferase [Sulfuriferula sp.]